MKSILSDTAPKPRKLRSSADLRNEITAQPFHLRRARSVLMGARQAAAEMSAQIISGSIFSPADDLDTPDTGRHLDLGKTLHEAAGLAFFVEALENDETCQEAMALLQPLYQEHTEAVERERIAQAAERAAWQERQNEKAAELAAAQADIEAKFASA